MPQFQFLDPFAKVSVVSSYPSRLHPFLRLLKLTSLTHAKPLPAGLRLPPVNTCHTPQANFVVTGPRPEQSLRHPRPAPDRRTAPSGLSGCPERLPSTHCRGCPVRSGRVTPGLSLLCSAKGSNYGSVASSACSLLPFCFRYVFHRLMNHRGFSCCPVSGLGCSSWPGFAGARSGRAAG